MNISIDNVGEKSMERVNAVLRSVPNGAFKAVYAAMRRAGDKAKTEAGRFASAKYAITKGAFMQNEKSKIFEKGTSAGVASISVLFWGNVLPLTEFATTYGNDGRVQTQVMRDKPATTFEHAFAAHMFGKTGVFERETTSRYPVHQLFGPSTAHMLENADVVDMMTKAIGETYEKRIEHEITRVLNGW